MNKAGTAGGTGDVIIPHVALTTSSVIETQTAFSATVVGGDRIPIRLVPIWLLAAIAKLGKFADTPGEVEIADNAARKFTASDFIGTHICFCYRQAGGGCAYERY